MIFDNNYKTVKRESDVEFTANCGKGDDDSSDDNDSVLEEDGAEPQLLKEELDFLFTEPRIRSGRMVRTSNKAVLWL